MALFGFLPVASRRAIVAVCATAVLAVASGSGLRAQAQAPAPPDGFKFDASDLFLYLTLKPAGVEAFEQTMGKVKEALAKSEKPERKAQAEHWKIFKAPQADGSVIYIWQLEQVNKDVTYNPFTIIGEGGMSPADVRALFDKVNPNIQIGRVDFKAFMDMKGGGGF